MLIQDVCSTAAVPGKADEICSGSLRLPPGQGPPRSLELGRSAIDADSFDGTGARRQHCGEDNHDEGANACLAVSRVGNGIGCFGPGTRSSEIQPGSGPDVADRKQHGSHTGAQALSRQSISGECGLVHHRGAKGSAARRRHDAEQRSPGQRPVDDLGALHPGAQRHSYRRAAPHGREGNIGRSDASLAVRQGRRADQPARQGAELRRDGEGRRRKRRRDSVPTPSS